MSRTIIALALSGVNAPTLAALLPVLAEPVPTPAWWYNPASDADLSPRDVAEADEYHAWLDAEDAACKRAARRDEDADMTPVGVDCGGFALGACEPPPRELTYEASAGVLFCDGVDGAADWW